MSLVKPGHRPRPEPYPDELDELFCDEDQTLCTDERPCLCCWIELTWVDPDLFPAPRARVQGLS